MSESTYVYSEKMLSVPHIPFSIPGTPTYPPTPTTTTDTTAPPATKRFRELHGRGAHPKLDRQGRALCRILAHNNKTQTEISQLLEISTVTVARAVGNLYSTPDDLQEDEKSVVDVAFLNSIIPPEQRIPIPVIRATQPVSNTPHVIETDSELEHATAAPSTSSPYGTRYMGQGGSSRGRGRPRGRGRGRGRGGVSVVAPSSRITLQSPYRSVQIHNERPHAPHPSSSQPSDAPIPTRNPSPPPHAHTTNTSVNGLHHFLSGLRFDLSHWYGEMQTKGLGSEEDLLAMAGYEEASLDRMFAKLLPSMPELYRYALSEGVMALAKEIAK